MTAGREPSVKIKVPSLKHAGVQGAWEGQPDAKIMVLSPNTCYCKPWGPGVGKGTLGGLLGFGLQGSDESGNGGGHFERGFHKCRIKHIMLHDRQEVA